MTTVSLFAHQPFSTPAETADNQQLSRRETCSHFSRGRISLSPGEFSHNVELQFRVLSSALSLSLSPPRLNVTRGSHAAGSSNPGWNLRSSSRICHLEPLRMTIYTCRHFSADAFSSLSQKSSMRQSALSSRTFGFQNVFQIGRPPACRR